ncbi:MAG: hypothetical protein ABR540_19150, partial [Acidimicrobiales bacterium]
EIDHVDGWALTRTTTLARLARLCRWHHHLKTYCGYRLDGTPGNWRWMAPEEPAGGEGGAPLYGTRVVSTAVAAGVVGTVMVVAVNG